MISRKSEQEGERIAKRIARAGLCSRREAEQWIFAGRVEVNGNPIASPALNVSAADRIKVDGKPLPERERTRLFLYHKPRGLVTSARDPEGRPTLFERLPKHRPRLVSIGRLDLNSEGLLLLTNDGGLARVLELPKTGWLRRYRVRAHGRVSQAALDALAAGITVDGIRYGPIEARLDREQGSNLWLTFAMREGKNREIRNVLGALGLQVNRLIRISFGPFRLGELSEGAVEEVATRVLREQIGERVAQEAGADFAAPVLRRAPDTSPLERESLPRTRSGVDRPKAGREGGAVRESSSEKIRRGLLTDRKGRRVAVERAGTGALGLEALSRGASFALLIDDGAEARALIRGNVEALGLGGMARIFRRDATKLGGAHPLAPFSLVFADPPYGKGFGEAALLSAREGGWLEPGALIVVEEAKHCFAAPEAFDEIERRAYDDTELIFLRNRTCIETRRG